MIFNISNLILRVVRDEANESEELWRDSLLLQLVMDQLGYILGQNFHQSLGGKLPHAIVLDRTSGQIWCEL